MNKVFRKSVYMLMSFMLLITMFAFPIGDRTAHADDVTFNDQWASMPVIPNMGVNLPGDMALQAFVDAFKYVRPFREISGSGFISLDEDGWPTTDARAILFDYRPVPFTPPFDDPDAVNRLQDISGTHHLSFKGQADIAPNPGSSTSWTIENQSYDAVTNTTTADFVIPPFTGDYLDFLVVINFSNTRRTADAELNTGISDIKLIKPGYPANTTQTFTDEFIRSFKPFSTIRFYEWNLGLGYLEYCKEAAVNYECAPEAIDWADRRSPTNTQFKFEKNGAPSQIAWEDSYAWEYIVELANETGKDAWINIPPQATDNYVAGLAKFMKENLNSGIKIYLEYSNEVWGGLAPPKQHNLNAACVEVTGKLCSAGSSTRNTSNLNVPATSVQDVWNMRLYARRTMEISNIFTAEYGAGSLNTIIRPVLAWQHVNPTGFSNILKWLDDTFGDPSEYIYGLASGIYMKCPPGTQIPDKSKPNQTVAVNKDDATQYDACFRADFVNKSLDYIAQNRAVADSYNLAYVAYEGGTSNGGNSTANLEARISAERLPSMTNLIKDFLNTWSKEGGELFNFFTLYGQPSRYGSWGLIEDLFNLETPKTRAVLELAADPAAAPTNLAINIGTSGMELTWDGDVISEGSDPYKYTSYSVLRSESAAGPFKLLKRGITTTNYIDTDKTLEMDTPYYYKVTAVNFGGSADSNVESIVMNSSENAGFLMAYEPFDYPADSPLLNLNGGNGWDGGWTVGNSLTISNGDPLVYPYLTHNGNYLINDSTTVNSTANRKFDLSSSGPFGDYLNSGGGIGKPGTTIWSSVVIRSEGTGSNFNFRPFVGQAGQSKVEIGYYGTVVDGNKVWEAKINYNEKMVPSSVPIVDGAPTLIVTKVEFESTENTNVSIYINPDLSSGVEPEQPDITSFFKLAGKTTLSTIYAEKGSASFDEIRYGSSFANVTPLSGAAPDPDAAPQFNEQPQGSVVSLGNSVTLNAGAQGTPVITYQWYKDSVEIPGATQKNLTIKNFNESDAGTYTVTATNATGTATSDPAVLTLGVFAGFNIERTSQAPVIGEFDSTVWANAQSYLLDKNVTISGGLDLVPPANHSGSAKALWDDDYLYLLYDITDDVLVDYDPIGPSRDDVELFLDRDNSKDGTYGVGDYQFIFAYDDTVGVEETKHGATAGVTYKSKVKSGGYLLEARIPWTTIGMTPAEGALLGWDMASDDTDGSGRGSKLAWHTNDNDIWQYPNLMGIAMLKAGDSTPDPDPETSLEAYIGEDFDLTLGLSDVTQDFNTVELNVQYDPAKLEFATEPLNLPEHPDAMALAAGAISVAPENPGLQIVGTAVLPDGTIHIIAMKTGGGMITDADKLFTLHGTVQSGIAEGSTTVLLADAVITEGDDVSPAGGNSYAITLKTRTVVDTTALADLINTAQGVLNAAATGTLPGQYPSSAKTALQNAISQAQTALGQTTADQDQIDQAVIALQQALNVFNGSVNVAELDKAALTAKIGKAQAKYDGMVEGTKVTQYTSGAKAALQAAINQATSVLGSATSQQDLDDAVTALESAMQTSGSQIVTLVPGETQITIKDLALLAKYYEMTREEANWGLYDTADIYGNGISIQVIAKVARLLLEDWLSQQ